MSRALHALDLALAVLVLGLGTLLVLPSAIAARLTTGPRGVRRRILYLGTGQIAQVFPRNGVNLFLERECSDFDGYFEQMWNVHFPAGDRGALDLSPRHHLLDFDVPVPRPVGQLKRTSMALREVAFLRWIIPFARRQGISVVTATNPYLQGVNAAVVGGTLGIPYAVIVTRDYDWDWQTLRKQAFPSVFPSRAIEKRVERSVFGRASLVLADRAFYRDYAVRNGAVPARAVATRVLADTAYACAERSRGTRTAFGLSDDPLLVYVGRLDPDKLVMDLVEVLARVRRRFPSTQLACAGTGALADAMRDRARELGIGDGLRLLGTLPLTQLPGLLASADVVVAAHMGYTLIEAGLTGAPIATYEYDYHGEILRDGETGFLAPLGDVDALADRVSAVLADPAMGAAVGARVRRRLLRDHSLQAVVPLYQRAYDRALQG